MIIKPARTAPRDIEALEALLQRPGLLGDARKRIDSEIRMIRAGEAAEREAAYEIDFHHGASDNWAVIHDLRLEHAGRVAQIDHLLIGRALDIWVCETKHFSEGVAVNDSGEFVRFFNNRPQGIASPIEQNRKHIAVLESIIKSDKVTLPTRFGMTIRPRFHSVILVSQKARVSRPKAKIEGLDTIVKSDQLRALMDRKMDRELGSVTGFVTTASKIVGTDTLAAFGAEIARLNRPLRRDWAATFGLTADRVAAPARPIAPPTAVVPPTPVAEAPVIAQSAAVATTPPERLTGGEGAVQEQREMLATSKLAAAMKLPNSEAMLTRLVSAGLLELDDGKHRLTSKGEAAGARYVEKSRFGPYFLWPADLRP